MKKEEIIRELAVRFGEESPNLIEVLQTAQDINGWLSEEVLEFVSEYTKIKMAEVVGVATFYAQFRLKPIGKTVVTVCRGTACHVNGADGILSATEEELGIKDGETTEDGAFSIESAACLGCCSLSPVMIVGGKTFGHLNADEARKIIRSLRGQV